ncbi:hypothetical protein PESP_b0602 [Pseudoalteromonas espejiana DSM 9414]|uniref:Uncharacterized protein n=1 Tax=Pseudoalteromonas espejiana TaxID=28107 RepID=A0A510XYQ9_9GAMM|nr:hypothetical protein PESP_b0602 [Pseudoalteromonas espejiana DSM 9414]GEK56172.1 hypothetical protein PES01_30170 [Pseudoalteromonas espejiana]
MKNQLRKTVLSLAIATCVGASGAAFGNETSSSFKGKLQGLMGNQHKELK